MIELVVVLVLLLVGIVVYRYLATIVLVIDETTERMLFVLVVGGVCLYLLHMSGVLP